MKPFEQIPFNPARWPFFYGWMVLLWGMAGVILSVPGQTTGVSAFIEPLLRDLGISRLQISGAYLFGTLASSLLITPSGKLFDRIGARWMGFGSCLALGVVLLLLSQTAHIAAILAPLVPRPVAAIGTLGLLFFLLRLTGQGILTISSRNMVMKWFDRHRGLASGISGATVSFGFSYAPTCFSYLIGLHGWSGSWFLMGLVLAVLFAPLLLFFFRDNPEACGLVPDGKPPVAGKHKVPPTVRSFTLAEARRTFSFWVFALTMGLQALVITAATFNIESIFEHAGMTGAEGFAIFPYSAFVAVAVNLLGGWLSDRAPLQWFLSTMLLAMAANLVGLVFLESGWPVRCMIIGNGIANGLFGILMSVTWPRYFGRGHLGAVSGLCMTLMVVFSSIGPAFYSAVLDLSGGYGAASVLCLAATLALFAASFLVRNPQAQRAARQKSLPSEK